ncbi:LPS-assembly protein LptD [Xylophilus sp. ASV27]|uniref:LPS-assembly protein LptD n=1 Tax=Xylophilus sp. ASV27 TaxID=2795129 RepID=UPI0018EE45CD
MHDLTRAGSRPGRGRRAALCAPTPLALLAAAMLQGSPLLAQPVAAPADEPAPALRRSPLLRDEIPSAQRKLLPSFVTGDSVVSETDFNTIVKGNAELRRGDTVIRANQLEYTQPDDLAKAQGNVYINRAGDIFQGPELQLHVDAFEGFFTRPRYLFLKNNAHGVAERVDFIDDEHLVIHNGSYTTCERRPGPSWMPDWMISARSISIDQSDSTGVAEGAVVRFKGLRSPELPSISFPLSESRQSGLLPPLFGINNLSGVELTQPYYWNIAPNRDATLYPTLMSKRGVNLGGEFRYLENDYRGQIRADYMPRDKLRERDRWGFAMLHSGGLDTGIQGLGTLGLNMNINRVSDDDYWRDFTRTVPSLTQRLLPADVNLNWGRGDFSVTARSLKWQTLQSVTSPIIPPYDRLPQVVARYNKVDVGGFDYSVEGDYTQFSSNPVLTGQPNAKRSYALAQISRPWVAPGWFITPKAQLHSATYDFQYALPSNNLTTTTRTVPTLSLDGGLVFERDTRLFGRSLIQTLEPRAFYVYTPFVNQNYLPVYDTARTDFNFASIYTENAFVGHDRISDNNLLTLGLTTRLIDADTGAEAARFGIAQRLRFRDQLVTLPGEAPTVDRLSDVMLGASVNWTRSWAFDSTVQYNQKTGRSETSSIGGRYSPGDFRTVSLAYRLKRDTSELIDVGWQWPLSDLWGGRRSMERIPGRGLGAGNVYAVGRLNYSMFDRSLVDGVVGVEYEGDCWIGRVVLERLQSSNTTSTKRILFQIEFFGFSSVGSNPLQALQRNVPRYQYLRQEISTPSRFSRYD